MSAQALTAEQTRSALADLPDWRADSGALVTAFAAPSSQVAVELMYQLGQLANDLDHHPDLDWRYDQIFLTISTHSLGSQISDFDVEFARRASALAAAAGAEARPDKALER
jgi:4a-hydroxytetrahydrobiopterin dehydratase